MKNRFFILILTVCLLFSACAAAHGPAETQPTPESSAPKETTAPVITTAPEITTAPTLETEPTETAPSETQPTAAQEPTDTTEPTVDEIPEAPLEYWLVPQSEAVDISYFDDVAFVGDSISLGLSYYQESSGVFGEAQFFASGSLSATNALWEISDESVHPIYQGAKTLVEDCIQYSGAKKIYIMLGINEIGYYGMETSLNNYITLIEKIKEKSPDVVIVVQSVLPMTTTSTILGSALNNSVIREYNEMLLATCESRGWYYLDVASVMYGEDGDSLNRDYCIDPYGLGIHMKTDGCIQWAEYLLTHPVGNGYHENTAPEPELKPEQ